MKTVLHVEDDLDAAYFLKRAFDKAKLPIDLRHLADGEVAIRYLDGINPFDDRETNPLPDLILLDLKMPLKDGFEVLTWIKEKENLRNIPVVILTSSDRDEDLRRSKSLGAAHFMTKTVSFSGVVTFAEEMLK